LIISFEKSFTPGLFRNEPLPSTRTQTILLVRLTRIDEFVLTYLYEYTEAPLSLSNDVACSMVPIAK